MIILNIIYRAIWAGRTAYIITHDKVWMYEEIMTNDDNLESTLLTSSLLKCVLWYKLNCVFTARWHEMK